MPNAPDRRCLPAPLVIGVTGHRDLRLEDFGHLEARVREILTEKRKQYPFTPIIFLSALAAGADRLAANVALEAGARLIVPLPMPQHLYEQDFESEESLAEFHRLLKQAEHRFTVKMLADEKEVAHPGPARNHQYEEIGKYIARESQILIALWDGTETDKVGGTAAVVKFQIEGMQDQTSCNLQPPELFPVYQIVTPRKSNPHPLREPFLLIKKYPKGFESDEAAEKYYDQIFFNLNEFNREIVSGDDALIATECRSKTELLLEFGEADLSKGELLDLGRYAVADALAQRYRVDMLKMDFALHWLVFFAFAGFVLFAHLHIGPRYSLTASLALSAVAVFVNRRAKQKRLDSKSLDYRAIAEGARVRFFWHLSGVQESVADNYLGKQRTELDWIRNGLRGWELETRMAPRGGPLPAKNCMEIARQAWVLAQIRYFQNAGKKNENELKARERLRTTCFLSAIAIAGMMLLATLLYHWPSSEEQRFWLDILLIAVDSLLVAGALLHHSTQQRAYAQHIKQFRRMEAVFGKALELVNQNLHDNHAGNVRQCLLNLGQEALSENGDWVLLHRERPLELPPP